MKFSQASLVELPWVIKTQDSSSLPEKITETGTIQFDNMEIDGAISLNVNVDKEEDTNLIIELRQSTNARLGHQRSTNVKIYGKRQLFCSKVSMELQRLRIIIILQSKKLSFSMPMKPCSKLRSLLMTRLMQRQMIYE